MSAAATCVDANNFVMLVAAVNELTPLSAASTPTTSGTVASAVNVASTDNTASTTIGVSPSAVSDAVNVILAAALAVALGIAVYKLATP